MKLRKAEQLAKRLIKEHCPEFKFKWDKAIKRFGCCKYRRNFFTQEISNQVISLSKKLTELNPVEVVTETILHEIGHALTIGHKHDYHWEMAVKRIGGNPQMRYSSEEVNVVQGKFKLKCPKCGKITHYQRRVKLNKACYICCNKYNYGRYSDEFKLEVV